MNKVFTTPAVSGRHDVHAPMHGRWFASHAGSIPFTLELQACYVAGCRAVSVGAASSAKSDLLAAPSNEVLHDEVSQTALTGAPSLPCASEASHRHRSTDAMPAELPQAASGQYSKNDIKDEDRSAAGRRAHEDESVAGSS